MNENQPRTSSRPKPRLTIGYLAPAMGGSQAQWSGVVDAARKHNVNLICFPGGGLRDPRGFQAQANLLYDLVGAENVDGVVSWASSIGNYVDADEIRTFHQHYRPLPVVTMGRTLEGFPSLLMDSYHGMREAIAHLVEVHGYRRLAFIRGPEGHVYAQERYRAYVEALEAYGIPLDLDLVTPPGDWDQSTGCQMIHLLLDQRGLQPQVDLEAVVTASDLFALGALEVLQQRGIQVPGEVGVVGFNDSIEGRAATPPLTSVAVPFYETGYQAVETLLALMAGEPVPEEVIVPSRLVIRESCGCVDPAVAQAAVGPVKRPSKSMALEDVVGGQWAAVLSDWVRAIGNHAGGAVSEWAQELLGSFVAELEGEQSGLFLSTLESVLRRVMMGDERPSAGSGQRVSAWHGAVSALRRNVLPRLDDEARARAEDLWQQARVVIGEAAQRAYARWTLRVQRRMQILREIEADLVTIFGMEGLMDVLAQELPRLSIPSCYLSLYDDPKPYRYPQPAPEWSRLILARDEGGRIELEAEGRRFPSPQLVPEEVLGEDRRYSFVAQPLYLQENQLGFVLFEMGPQDASVYEGLREGISSALYGALLLRERQRAEEALEKAYAEVERQVEERTAELQREVTERERAQEENLRLQQEIIEAQTRALQELSTPVIPILERIIVMPLIGSVDTQRARDVTRRLLAGIREHHAQAVILDITGVPVVDSGVASHLNKTIQAARLKGARTIITGISDAIAETIVDLGIDWSGIDTLQDLQTGLRVAMAWMGQEIAW
jgi:DNA-binding LacI/PurR family transcriptional regulator/anti-anti-sigma regulatory factor